MCIDCGVVELVDTVDSKNGRTDQVSTGNGCLRILFGFLPLPASIPR